MVGPAITDIALTEIAEEHPRLVDMHYLPPVFRGPGRDV